MKNTVKSILKVLLIVFLVLYLGLEVFVTVCLLNFNDQKITVLGKKSLIIVDEGAKTLSELLKINSTLIELDLSCNEIE